MRLRGRKRYKDLANSSRAPEALRSRRQATRHPDGQSFKNVPDD